MLCPNGTVKPFLVSLVEPVAYLKSELSPTLGLRDIIHAIVALTSGARLGPYEIVCPLGAGGMGEVYRARDTRLERTVAIKILPAQFSSDPLRKQRFEREAKTISSLNHPNICVLF